ncbi:MAG: exopolysaccharide biosynthesis polyprenyl glycosylphosphotransferase [Bryobacterales bacterium]|nr:exopolysaccharide biosynthesis polyprenyl glycosylphosphotransferase [Bryobacterales bacterium]
MKLVYVVTRADAVGGASIHVRDLAREMISRGHDVTVLLGGSGPVTERLAAANIPFQSLRYLGRSIRPLRDLLATRELTAALRALRPDLVSTHTAKAGLVGRLACRKLNLPCIYTPHGFAIGNRISPLLGPVFAFLERTAARWCAAIVCVCESERRLALEKGIGPAPRLHVIYNGMPDAADADLAKPGEEPVRICSVARLESPKDHETLFEALAALPHRRWSLELVGDGPLEEHLRALAKSLNLEERIVWSGYLPDPSAALARAHVFVLATHSEAFPRSILEAMRAGLPVAASDVGGVPEAVSDGRTGFLAPVGDPEALSAAIAELIENAPLRQRMGGAGHQTFNERFRFERMAEETLALYRLVVRAPRQGDEMGNGTTSLNLTGNEALLATAPVAARQGGLLGGAGPVIKRFADVVFALVLILIALPFAILIALAILLETRGPILFKQSRIGQNNRRFALWKFRSMAADSERLLESYLAEHPDLREEWNATHKLKDDPRVTRVGRFLRRRSLDELPQLWNVLRGDMSLIGPRPIVDAEIPKFGRAFALYLKVKPGLTGLWQVSGRSDTSYRRRVELDSQYIRGWSLWLDLKIIWKTVGVVLRAHGAY